MLRIEVNLRQDYYKSHLVTEMQFHFISLIEHHSIVLSKLISYNSITFCSISLFKNGLVFCNKLELWTVLSISTQWKNS